MSLIGTLNTFVAGTVIDPSEVNSNFSAIRTAFNDSAVLTDVAKNITVQHTFAPTVAQAPFALNANAQGQLVTGLNADQLDGQEGSYYQNAGNLNAGSIPDARVPSSAVTQHQGSLAIATSQVTSGTFADARIAASNVTQHQAALSIAASQISSGTLGVTRGGTGVASPTAGNLLIGAGASAMTLLAPGLDGGFVRSNGTSWVRATISASDVPSLATSKITSGTFADALIAASNVTQHQAALSIATTQLTGNMPDARIVASNVTQHQAALSIATTQLTGNMPDARIVASNVTQHQASLSIAATQLTGTIPSARLSGAYTGITGLGTLTSLTVGTGGVSISGILKFTYTALNFGASVAAGATVVDTLSASGVSPDDIILVQVASGSGSLDPTTRGFTTGGIVSVSNIINVYITNAHSSAVDMSDIDLEVLVFKV